MHFTRKLRTDLIIGMTLAELFLLILFVVWYGYKKPDQKTAALVAENEQLKRERKIMDQQIVEMKREVQLWHRVTGLNVPPAGGISSICRSNPKCDQSDNVLIHASVRNGQISFKMIAEPLALKKWWEDSGYVTLPIGVEVSDPSAIQQFIDGIQSYYPKALINGKQCRFDYRLSYSTKADYYDGRMVFERVFYPADIRAVR